MAAARALHLTSSGVSQHLAKLEAEAGVALVDRTSRGVGRTLVLTAAGQVLADQGEQIAAALAGAHREIGLFRSEQGGTVRIGGFASVLNDVVARSVISLALTDPGIDPRLFEVEESLGVRHLAAGELDLLLSERRREHDPPRPGNLLEQDLLRDPFRIVVPASWPADVSADEILTGPWVLAGTQSPSRQALERVATAHRVTLDVRHVAHQAATMLAFVAAGLGAAIIPQLALTHHDRGQTRVHPGPLDPGARTITVLQRRDTTSPAIERAILELQRNAAAEEQALHSG